MNVESIPFSFASKNSELNWTDCLWAYERQIFSWRDLVEYAKQQVNSGLASELEIELSDVDKETVWKVSQLSQRLAETDRFSEEISKNKWLFLYLAWLFENRHEIEDPLGQVETVYADFNYPSTIESFVRFLPPSDGYNPAGFSPRENDERLFFNWRMFLEKNRFHRSGIGSSLPSL